MVGVLTTAIAGVSAVLDEECILAGRTAAYCNYTYIGGSNTSMTSTSYTTVITGDLYVEYPVTLTAGTEKLSVAETQVPTTAAVRPDVATGTASASGAGTLSSKITNYVAMLTMGLCIYSLIL